MRSVLQVVVLLMTVKTSKGYLTGDHVVEDAVADAGRRLEAVLLRVVRLRPHCNVVFLIPGQHRTTGNDKREDPAESGRNESAARKLAFFNYNLYSALRADLRPMAILEVASNLKFTSPALQVFSSWQSTCTDYILFAGGTD